MVDHIDGDPLNNKIENLRACSKSQNGRNAKMSKRNKSGVKGVYWNKTRSKWHAEIKIKGKRYFQKYYDSIEEAKVDIEEARTILHADFANNGVR